MTKSQELFTKAQNYIPGGVNSPVRAYQSVGGTPPFITKGEGPYLYDEDGLRYIDYVNSWGPILLGHNHPDILQAVISAAQDGLSFGAATRREVEMAELLCSAYPLFGNGTFGKFRHRSSNERYPGRAGIYRTG